MIYTLLKMIDQSVGRALTSNADDTLHQSEDDDIEVPEETEDVLQDLFKALQDRVKSTQS